MAGPDTVRPVPVASRPRARAVGLALGPALALAAWLALADDPVLTGPGRVTVSVAVLMATWWLTEAVPLAVTALLPATLFPVLGIADAAGAAAPYASPIVFLFLGGFVIGLAMEKVGLHRRIALHVLARVGTAPSRLVGGVMLVSAGLSMWISNTATAIMMLPIGTSVLVSMREHMTEEPPPRLDDLGRAMMLGIAYGATIGGLGTLLGSPPNLVLASFLRARYGVDLGMVEWLQVGLPVMVVMLPVAWLWLTRVAFRLPGGAAPGAGTMIASELRALGPMRAGERRVLLVFTLAVVGWMSRPWIVAATGLRGLDDASIALLAALALFAIPLDARARHFVIDWSTMTRLPWEVLILFGGGLSLAAAIAAHGVDGWLGAALQVLAGLPALVIMAGVCTLVVFLTEVTSNTAVTTTLLPVVAAAAAGLGVPPAPLLGAVALSASCAFMLPVATPPNAVVFASGQVAVADMARAGLALNLVAIVVLTAYLGLAPGVLNRLGG
ncbi:MAG: DASS family sodium-coupled anion symporter [Ectothiorhodospiraceae bacterium]|nr:DASS family sodium-coupled anion symporter [Chromatiales bacterium]MCP5153761.1 DASS family sodium-coupled anion symporter [Ectothiorhodospiraceae bacterium]